MRVSCIVAQVCSGGLAVGALALGDVPRHAELAKRNFQGALAALPISVGYWAPKGAWWEGDSYTSYAAKYLTAALASFETAGVAPSSGGLDLSAFTVKPSMVYMYSLIQNNLL